MLKRHSRIEGENMSTVEIVLYSHLKKDLVGGIGGTEELQVSIGI